MRLGAVLGLLLGCSVPSLWAQVSAPTPAAPLPPIPTVKGPLELKVIYPEWKDLVDAGDTSFIFGSTGNGDAKLTVNGYPVPVWPNGAWLAWMPIPRDTLMRFDLVAKLGRKTAKLTYLARRVPRWDPPASGAWIDPTSLAPSGRVWWPADEYLTVTVRAVPGAAVRILLPDGTVVPLQADIHPAELPWGIRAFDRDTEDLQRPLVYDRYAGVIRGVALGDDPGPLVGRTGEAGAQGGCCRMARAVQSPRHNSAASPAFIEAILGADTVRMPWPVQLALLDTLPVDVELAADTSRRNGASATIGRAAPGAAYAWFFPAGTRATVSGRMNDDLRLRLSPTSLAWIPAGDASPLPRGLPAITGVVGATRLQAGSDRVTVRIPLSQRIPFRVTESDRSLTVQLYGAVGNLSWLQYGPIDSLVRRLSWTQESSGEVDVLIELGSPVWGYRARFDRNDLLIEVRRPPVIDLDHPFRGRLIVLDPGHPPLGAKGPTGLREDEVTLAVAKRLQPMLEAAGARVLLTRSDERPVDLAGRVRFADSVGAELLLSIHNNGLPDGVNPFRNNGSSVYYNQPRSLALARQLQQALVARIGLSDLGVGRGDLALVRPTWMPSALAEGYFMMIPEQENAMRTDDGQIRYATALFEGLEAYLRGVGSR